MAVSRWSPSITSDFNVLLLKQRVAPISRCINQRVRVTPLARVRLGCTVRRVANGRLRTAVPRIKRGRNLHSYDLTPSNVASNAAVSQHILQSHEPELVYEELDRSIVIDSYSSYSFQSEPYHARDVFTCGIVNGRANVSSFTSISSSPGEDATVAFSAGQRGDGVKAEPPRDRPTPAQLSFVLLKLREELPHIFHPHYYLDTYVYSSDVRLENKLLAFLPSNVRGRTSYRLFIRFWQVLMRCSYGFPELQLMKITKEEEKGEIHARWRICGYSRSATQNKDTPQVVMEGFSEFAVNPSGHIHVHRITKVMPVHKAIRRGPLSWLAHVAGLLGLTRQKPLAPV